MSISYMDLGHHISWVMLKTVAIQRQGGIHDYHIYLDLKRGFLLFKMTQNMLISPTKFCYKMGISL